MRTINDLIWQERDDAREQAMNPFYEYKIEKLTLEEFYMSEGISFSSEFTNLHWDTLNSHDNFSKYVTLTEDFVRHFQFRIDWDEISWSQTFSYSFIREFKDRVCWTGISYSHHLTEAFIEEFQEYVIWDVVAENQILSEQFVRRFHRRIEHVHWNQISKHQQLSESFIRRFIDLLNIESIFANQKLSMGFINEFGFRVERWRRQMATTRFIEEWIYNHWRQRIEGAVEESLFSNIPLDVIRLINSYLS